MYTRTYICVLIVTYIYTYTHVFVHIQINTFLKNHVRARQQRLPHTTACF